MRRLVVVILAVALALTLTACGGGDEAAEAPAEEAVSRPSASRGRAGSLEVLRRGRMLRLEQQHAFEHDRGLPEHPGLEVALGQRHQVLRIA